MTMPTLLDANASASKIPRMRARFFLGVLPVTIGLIGTSAQATTTLYQTLTQGNGNLTHQWSFDGSDIGTAGADQQGSANLTEQLYGTGASSDLVFGVTGWDGTSSAVSTHRVNPGGDGQGGAYLRATGANQITWGNSFSFEAIVQADQATLGGGSFNLSYILSSRVGNDRGYFLTQGGPIPSTGVQWASTMGNGHNAGNTNTVHSTITAGNWYYIAGSYVVGAGNVTWTNYVADLTAGDISLASTGSFTNSGGTYPVGTALDVGIGGRWDGTEAFDGQIDEISVYNAALTQGDFQGHLDALLAPVPEPTQAILILFGALAVLRRRR